MNITNEQFEGILRAFRQGAMKSPELSASLMKMADLMLNSEEVQSLYKATSMSAKDSLDTFILAFQIAFICGYNAAQSSLLTDLLKES